MIENANYFNIFCDEASVGTNFNGGKEVKLELSVRRFCLIICRFIDVYLEENKDKKIPYFNIRRFDKQIEELNELNIINKNLLNKK